jgi:hypothetical protein
VGVKKNLTTPLTLTLSRKGRGGLGVEKCGCVVIWFLFENFID